MIPISKHLPKQMNGPVVNSEAESVNKEFTDAEKISDYLHGLSIDTAQETELENIGRLIGFVRPLVPIGFNAENIFLLGPLPLQTDAKSGLAEVGSSIGGRLGSVQTSESEFLDLGQYRILLTKVAKLKRYGVTLQSVCDIAAEISQNFTLTFNADKDIVITFSDAIGYKNVWLLTNIFFRVATAPQVLIASGD